MAVGARLGECVGAKVCTDTASTDADVIDKRRPPSARRRRWSSISAYWMISVVKKPCATALVSTSVTSACTDRPSLAATTSGIDTSIVTTTELDVTFTQTESLKDEFAIIEPRARVVTVAL